MTVSAMSTTQPSVIFTLELTTFQVECLEEALTEYLVDGDPTEAWYLETEELLNIVKRRGAP